jgi:serine O-acetyltransferase
MIVKMSGGIWKIRQRYKVSGNKLMRAFYIYCHNVSLQRKGSWISMSAEFSGEPCFPHGIYGIFISGGAVIGRNCVIFQHVMIGSNTLCDSGGMGAPRIGDDCYIGVGAKIIGDICVGNNVRIGANTFVYQDVSDNSVITCGTPRIIRMRRKLNNRYYHLYRGHWTYFENGEWLRVQDPGQIASLNRKFVRKPADLD